MATPQDILRGAAQLLREKGWTTHAFARLDNSFVVPWDYPHACRFCLSGAVQRAASDLHTSQEAASVAVGRVVISRGYLRGTVRFNDEQARSVDDVIAIIDEAIAWLDAVDAATADA